MRRHTLRSSIPLLAVCLVPMACVLTTEAVITDSHAMFDPRLLGQWEVPADSERVEVSRGEGNSYRITFTEAKGETAQYSARLGRIGDRLMLEVQPADPTAQLPAGELFVPQHLLLGIEIGETEVRIALLEVDSIRAAVKSGRLRGAHEVSGNRLVLSGTTNELRTQLSAVLARPGVFAEWGIWTRPDAARTR